MDLAFIARRLDAYERLIRLDKPIGTLLLLWPTLWAVWLAADGRPSAGIVLIFVLGTLLMRSAGCAVNDYADREFDPHVERTRNRPLAAREIAPWEALVVGGTLLCTSWLQPFALPAYGLYAAVCAVEAVRVGHRLGAAAILITWAIFPVLHLSHGMGFAAGLVRYGLRPDWDAGELLPPAPAR